MHNRWLFATPVCWSSPTAPPTTTTQETRDGPPRRGAVAGRERWGTRNLILDSASLSVISAVLRPASGFSCTSGGLDLVIMVRHDERVSSPRPLGRHDPYTQGRMNDMSNA